MPLNVQALIKRAGSVETAAELHEAFTALRDVIGSTVDGYGLDDIDIVGPIPNAAFGSMSYVQSIPFRCWIPNGSALGYPITSLVMPFSGQLRFLTQSALFNHVLVIAKNDTVVYRANVTASGPPSIAAPETTITFRRFKDTITVVNYASGTTLPTVGQPLGAETIEVPAHYDLWFSTEDE